MSWGEAVCKKLEMLFESDLNSSPFTREFSIEGREELIKEWRTLGDDWHHGHFVDTPVTPYVGYAGLKAMYEVCKDQGITGDTIAAGEIEPFSVLFGDYKVIGDLNLEELGPLVVLGSLEVEGHVFCDLAGPPLMVAENLKCSALNAGSYTIVGGNLEAGDLFLMEGNDGPMLVGGRIQCRIALAREGEYRLWQPSGLVDAELVQLSAHDLYAEVGEQRGDWWLELETLIEQLPGSGAFNPWDAFLQSQLKFKNPPRFKRFHQEPQNLEFPTPLKYKGIF